jgi:hypothetical protein
MCGFAHCDQGARFMAKKRSPIKAGRTRRKPPASESPAADFVPETLDRSVIAIPLLDDLERKKKSKSGKSEPHAIIIDLNLNYPSGTEARGSMYGKRSRR